MTARASQNMKNLGSFSVDGKNALLAEVCTGELIDKITILELKLAHFADAEKRANVQREYDALSAVWEREVAPGLEVVALRAELKEVNAELWEIEDAIRDQERAQDFGAEFVRLARAVYRTNDRRFDLKRRINEATGSRLKEEKGYAAY